MAQSVVPIVFLFGTGVERAQELWVGKIDGPVELPLAEQAGHRHEELPVPRIWDALRICGTSLCPAHAWRLAAA